MGNSHDSTRFDALLRDAEAVASLKTAEPQHRELAELISRLAEALRELLWDRDRLAAERDLLLEERNRMAGRLTRGVFRNPEPATLTVP